jgi:DNA-binding SARP family transcriptional activator
VSAAHTVETYVSRLRRLFNDLGRGETLLTRPPGYLLQVDRSELDLSRFEALVHDGRRELADEHPHEAACLLREALALFRGSPLDDLAFLPFAHEPVKRLADLRLTVVEEQMEAELRTGRAAELVGALERLVSAYPLRERLQEQLMRALYGAGRQAEALQAFRRIRTFLMDELGIEPGSGLRDLEQAMLTHDPALDASTSRVRPSSVSVRPRAVRSVPPVTPLSDADPPSASSYLGATVTGCEAEPVETRRRLVVIAIAAGLAVVASVVAFTVGNR